MRETNFIKQNKEKWQEFERTLDSPRKDPDKLNDLFVQITDDLSYSRTFYPNRSVRVYLNGLAQRVFGSIYKKRKAKKYRFISFWTEEVPLLFYNARRDFLIAFLVFGVAFLIGLVSSRMDPEFAEIILGPDYIEMTQENIQSGDPMAVYKQKGRFDMALAITVNNLWVAFLTFIIGAIYGVGTIAILVRNGVMVGAFQYFFIERGLFWESFLTIWIHGTLEISAIIIAGAAGLTMGRGLAFPGTFSRLRSFQQSARRGLKILMGIAPIFIIAGFIEGYLTRQTDTPDIIRLFFILACLAFVIFYFIVYPRIVARRASSLEPRPTTLSPDIEQDINFGAIKTNGQIFGEAFILFRKNWRPILGSSALFAIIYCNIVFGISNRAADELFYFPYEFMGTISQVNEFFINKKIDFLPIVMIPLLALYFAYIFRLVIKEAGENRPLRSIFRWWFKALPGTALLLLILWTNEWYTVFLVIFGGAYPLVWIFTSIYERSTSLASLGRSFGLVTNVFGKALGTMLILMMIGFLFFSLLDTVLFSLYFDMVSWLTNLEGEKLDALSTLLQVGTSVFMLMLILSIILMGMGLLYFSLLEIKEAPGLMARINEIGQDSRIKGLERER